MPGYITPDKANTFLDENKLSFADQPDLDDELARATALIRSRLKTVYPDSIDNWITPSTTPALIQDVAGALCAAWRYSKVYSEEQHTSSSFAVALEARAMELLDGLASGLYVLVEESTPGVRITASDFYPNDAADDDPDNARRFTMGMSF